MEHFISEAMAAAMTVRFRARRPDSACHCFEGAEPPALLCKLRQQAYQLVVLQEKERMRMAQDRHDGLGPLLSLIAQQIHLGLRDGDNSRLQEARLNVQRVITELGYIIHDLAPRNLEEVSV